MTTLSIDSLFLVLILLLVLSAFFSGSETALMSVNRYKLKHRVKKKDDAALKVNYLLNNPDKTLGLILLLNNFVNILASAITTLIAIELYGDKGIAIAAGILIANWTPVGEFFKNLFSGVIGWVQKAFAWVGKLLKPLEKVAGIVGKGFKSVAGVFSDDENKSQKIGDTVKEVEDSSFSDQQLLETSNISNIAGNNSSSNISISAPITINARTDADEKTIANQVRIAIDEVMHKFAVRKQALNYD